MRQRRWIPCLLVILSLGLTCFPMQREAARFHAQPESFISFTLPRPHSGNGPSSRSWWGLLYDNALLLARMDDGEQSENETEENADTVEYVWPILSWLLALLQPAAAQ